jgi:hypothetical protein
MKEHSASIFKVEQSKKTGLGLLDRNDEHTFLHNVGRDVTFEKTSVLIAL